MWIWSPGLCTGPAPACPSRLTSDLQSQWNFLHLLKHIIICPLHSPVPLIVWITHIDSYYFLPFFPICLLMYMFNFFFLPVMLGSGILPCFQNCLWLLIMLVAEAVPLPVVKDTVHTHISCLDKEENGTITILAILRNLLWEKPRRILEAALEKFFGNTINVSWDEILTCK